MRHDAWKQRALVTETSARRSVLRPPSEATVLLIYEMVNVWRRFFLPALFCSVAGVSCFLLTLVMARLEKLLAILPAVMPADILTRVMAGLATLLAAMQSEDWLVAALILVPFALFLAACYRFPLPALLYSVAGVSCFLLARVMARLDALPAVSPGTGAAMTVSPSAPPPPHPSIWIMALLVFGLLALFLVAYYHARGPRLGHED